MPGNTDSNRILVLYYAATAVFVVLDFALDFNIRVALLESLVTLSALIISLGMRVLLVTDRVLDTGAGFITLPEIYNFLISGGVAYVAWVRGLNRLKSCN